MSALINIKDLGKRFGAQTLFTKLSISVESGERMAIIGPNGAGKSTLLKIMAGVESADSGSVIVKDGTRVSYVSQTASFDEDQTVLEQCTKTALESGISESELLQVVHSALAAMELHDPDVLVSTLSGGQRKRLQIAQGLSVDPDLLFLDEPTNHLDIATIMALEKFLARAPFAWIVVSHDRFFLENAVSRIVEINPSFPNGMFSSEGGYSDYLSKREDYLAADAKNRNSLENKVRTEQAWLRQGAKARSTKSKKRTADAYSMMDKLNFVRTRQREQKVQIEFNASDRKTKKLAELVNVSKGFDGTDVFSKLDLKVTSGLALGILGVNGSGKSTFVKLLTGEYKPDTGTIKRADDLQLSVFSQFSETVDPKISLKEYLAPDSDSVVYRDKELHVVSWARRFQFSFEQLNQPFSRLSGGEQARARIAHLMLESPDILILDEPTNDLDIETLNMLEESLVEFGGALILVSHDRFMINRVCNSFLGLDGLGNAEVYADYEQWERAVFRPKKSSSSSASGISPEGEKKRKSSPKKLTYKEQREFDMMEETILEKEDRVAALQADLAAGPEAEKMQEICSELAKVQAEVDLHYARWQELEKKVKSFQK